MYVWYTKAEKYPDYFSEYDPMKSYYQGRLLQKQGKIKEAYEKYENIIFSGFSTLNFVLFWKLSFGKIYSIFKSLAIKYVLWDGCAFGKINWHIHEMRFWKRRLFYKAVQKRIRNHSAEIQKAKRIFRHRQYFRSILAVTISPAIPEQ